MSDLTTVTAILAVVWDGCSKSGAEDWAYVASKVEVKLNQRTTAWYGRILRGQYRIDIGMPMYMTLSVTDRRDIILHETAHVLAYHIHHIGIAPHGSEWKEVARKIGCSGRVTLKLKAIDGYLPPGMFHGRCDCGLQYITRNQHGKMLRGRLAYCTTCKNQLLLLDQVP